MKIYSLKSGGLNEADRLEIARLLLKAGYTVKIDREKPKNARTFNYYIEYWESDTNEKANEESEA